MRLLALFLAVSLSACASTASAEREPICANLPAGDVCAFDPARDADADLAVALDAAYASDTKTLLVMGADWCHDSRALAGHFESDRMSALLSDHYRLVFVDVAKKNKNLQIARRYGFDAIKGTPTVLVIDSDGTVLNRDTAPTWRNAASRSADDIYDYFAAYAANRTPR